MIRSEDLRYRGDNVIVVDVSEKNSIVFRQLEKLKVQFEVRKLEVGDYFVNDFCIERKEINDYVNSLISGRLQRQLYQMSYNYPVSVLIVEGYIEEVYPRIKRQTYLSSLAGTIFKRAPDGKQGIINLVMLGSPFDTALFLKYLNEKVERGEPRLPIIAKKKARDDKERLLSIISSLPGISEVRAEKLLRHFGSIHAIFNASVDELMKVEGIGEKTAKQIYEIIRKEVRL